MTLKIYPCYSLDIDDGKFKHLLSPMSGPLGELDQMLSNRPVPLERAGTLYDKNYLGGTPAR
jgi:hypothetical protein